MAPIRNLVFDLGGVLYAIDPARTTQKLLALLPDASRKSPADWAAQAQPLFDALEAGAVTPQAFRHELRDRHGLQATDDQIDAAWNSLLIGVIPGRARDIAALKGRYRLILLSNTNTIHQAALREECKELFAPFERLFFSFDMGLRKPDPAIFTTALMQMGMEPAESLFIDDVPENVQGAIQAGLQGHHIPPNSNPGWQELMARLA